MGSISCFNEDLSVYKLHGSILSSTMTFDNQVNSIISFEVIFWMVPEHDMKGQEAF